MKIHEEYQDLINDFPSSVESVRGREIFEQILFLRRKIAIEYFIYEELGIEIEFENNRYVREFMRQLQKTLIVFSLQSKKTQSKVNISGIILREAEIYCKRFVPNQKRWKNTKINETASEVFKKADDIIGLNCPFFPALGDRIINWGVSRK